MRRTIMLEGTGVPLEAECTDQGWNGYHVPILTRDELADYLAACKQNDPNGEWDERPFEDDRTGTLRLPYWDDPFERESDSVFESAGDGRYLVDGFVWVDFDPNF